MRACVAVEARAIHPRLNMRKDNANIMRRVARSKTSNKRTCTPREITRQQRRTPPLGSSLKASDMVLRREVLMVVKLFM